MEEIIDNWDMILELGDEDALALFIGECILRVHRAPVVSWLCILVIPEAYDMLLSTFHAVRRGPKFTPKPS